MRRITQLLEGLRAGSRPARAQQLDAIAQRLDASCRLRFAAAMEVEFAEALQALGANPGPANPDQGGGLTRIEDAARGLYGLRQEARRIEIPLGPDAALAMLDAAPLTP